MRLPWLRAIPPLDHTAMEKARHRLDRLTKPRRSLGRLEEIVVELAGMEASASPQVAPAAAVVAAADHGVVAEGVSLYPQEVTAQMVRNFVAGGAAVNVLCRELGVKLLLVDAGVGDVVDAPLVRTVAPRRVSGNIAREPAMTEDEAEALIHAGIALAEEQAREGVRLLIPADMGIGNTTAAATLAALILGISPGEVTGRGTGLSDAQLAHKRNVIERAVARAGRARGDAFSALVEVGGLEIAFLVGLILGGASLRIPILLDGVIVGAAALVATRVQPAVRPYLIAAHRSPEPAHRHILESMGLLPLLDLGMRLGEGSGALVAYPVLRSAIALYAEMATFREAEVSDPFAEA